MRTQSLGNMEEQKQIEDMVEASIDGNDLLPLVLPHLAGVLRDRWFCLGSIGPGWSS